MYKRETEWCYMSSKTPPVKVVPNEQPLAKALIAGTVCAVVAAFLNGFDVTKIRLQNQKTVVYTGMISGMKKIYREEGFRGLAKGVEASMWREVAYSSVRIGAYEPIRKLLAGKDEDPANTSPIIKYSAALISGGTGSALANPLDLVKTRFQAVLPNETNPYRNTAHALLTIYRQQGFAGLYRGWMVTSSRAAVLTSAQLGTYDSIKHNFLIKVMHMKEGILLHFACSMIAGVVTTTAANPFDVIKTRYLSDDGGRYKSILDCVRQTYRGEGIRAFIKGWLPAYMRLGPHTVIAFTLIEEIRTLLGMNNI